MEDHVFKAKQNHIAAMHRWEIAFNNNNGRMSDTERHFSRLAYKAYCAWKDAEEEAA